MKLLVAGATGGLGRVVVAEAVKRGHELRALVRDPARSNLPEVVRTVQGDVLEPASLDAAVEGRDAVICVLGTPSPRRASSLLEDGTRNLIDAMKRARVPRLVCVTLLGTADSKRNASPLYRSVILRARADGARQGEPGARRAREWPRVGAGTTPTVRQPRGWTAAPDPPGRERGAWGMSRGSSSRVLIDGTERPDYVHQAIVVGP